MEKYAYDQKPDWVQRLPNGMPDYPMARNLKIRPECLGLELPSVPFADKTSAQRMNMFTTTAPQALIVNGAEFPQVASGYEREYMKYTFNATRFDQDGIVLRAIPKFRTGVGPEAIHLCPEYLLIWYGMEDGRVHCCHVSTYTKGTNGFGWENIIDRHKMAPGSKVFKDECISHSKAVQGAQYCPGLNANMIYMTLPGTVEDAVIASKSFTKRAIATGYRELIIDIDKDMIPINLYGDRYNYKFIPDIGEKVGEGGMLCALRKVDEMTYYSDFTEQALMEVQPLHDDVYYNIEPGASVVDITVIRNPNKKILTPARIFQQLEKYEAEFYNFHEAVIKAYEEECVAKGRLPAHEFNTAVIQSGRILTTVKKKVLGASRKTLAKFKRKDLPISHIQLIVTVKYDIKPNRGSKITGYWGNKGTISQIVDDEHMPVNEHGIRAELVMSPMGVPNRMNPGQLFQTYVSEICRAILEQMRSAPTALDAWDILLDGYTDLNEEFANLIAEEFKTDGEREIFAREIMAGEYLTVVMPPALKNVTAEWVLRLAKKYDIRQTPVAFDQLDSKGRVIRRLVTKRPMFIGKNYAFVLCKVPFCKSSGMGFVNDIGVPITVKDATTKAQTPIAPTAIRAGEDETRTLECNVGPTLAARLIGINANSPDSTKCLALMLLTAEKPTQLAFIPKTDEDITNSSRTIAVLRNLMEGTGLDISDPIASPEEIKNFYEPFAEKLESKC